MCEVGETEDDLLVTLGQAFVDEMVDDESKREGRVGLPLLSNKNTRNTISETLQNQSARTPGMR